MALPVQTQAKYWTIAAAFLIAALWFLGDVILPFVLGGAIAYFLDPVADRLEEAGCSRVLATAIISVFAVVIFIIAILLIVPSLVSQAVSLVNVAPPDLFTQLQGFLTERFPPDLMDQNSTCASRWESWGGAPFRNVVASWSARCSDQPWGGSSMWSC